MEEDRRPDQLPRPCGREKEGQSKEKEGLGIRPHPLQASEQEQERANECASAVLVQAQYAQLQEQAAEKRESVPSHSPNTPCHTLQDVPSR